MQKPQNNILNKQSKGSLITKNILTEFCYQIKYCLECTTSQIQDGTLPKFNYQVDSSYKSTSEFL